MTFEKPEDFYKVYAAFKRYQTPVLKKKHLNWYGREIWTPAQCSAETSFLELGSGPGEFLAYLKQMGVKRFLGVEMDAAAIAAMPPGLEGHLHQGDIWEFLDGSAGNELYDRVVILDVLEHFTAFEGARLLEKIKGVLTPGGLVVVRVPNLGSPWGGIHQFADLTHKCAYTPKSLEQLGMAAGYKTLRFLPQRRGSPFRRFAEDCLHGLLSRLLTVTPEVWTANMIAIMQRENGGEEG
jgi:SAM-dependent methyltransferase